MLIETKRLLLRPVEMEDARFLADLINDLEVRESLGSYSLVSPLSIEAERAWIAQINLREKDSHVIIEVRREKKPIGILSVKDLDNRNSSAHISIIIEKKSWDNGYGGEAIETVLSFLFDRLNMHRVWLRVEEENVRALRCYEKCGFKFDGILREDHFTKGAWKNSLIMSILSEEHRGKKK